MDKSTVFPSGSLAGDNPFTQPMFGLKWTLGPVIMLGITFDHFTENLFRLNFPPKLSRLKRLLALWSQRDLTPLGKVTIVKSLGLSQFVYLFQVLPDPPVEFVKELERIIFKFIWAGKPEKIKCLTLYNPTFAGGLGVTHIPGFIRSLKCTWLKRYLDDSEAVWKLFFDFYLQKYGKKFLFSCNFKGDDIVIDNCFLQDVCKAWSTFSYYVPTSNFKKQIIWNNSHIKVNNEIIYYEFMYSKGVVYVDDLLDVNNRFLTVNCFKRMFNITYCPFTFLYGIYSAIPKSWRPHFIESDTVEENVATNLSAIGRMPSISRGIYKSIVKSLTVPPKAIAKWNREFNLDPGLWNTIFQIPFSSLRDSKLKYFQFRFLHRILGTNKLLFLMKQRADASCTFCNQHEETLSHLFWDCELVSNFILDVEQRVLGQQFSLSKQDLFFGYNFCQNHPYNFLIFNIKYFIYRKRMSQETPNCVEFLHNFKFLLQVEKRLSSTSTHHPIKFESLRNAFNFCNTLFD